jgi:hypothetical protein
MERCKTLVAEGKMTQKTFDESLALTKDLEKLPERLHPKKEKKDADIDFGPEPKK